MIVCTHPSHTHTHSHTHCQLISLRTELKQGECEAEERRERLEASLRQAKEQLVQARAAQELQARQAENAIEDFKAQVRYHDIVWICWAGSQGKFVVCVNQRA